MVYIIIVLAVACTIALAYAKGIMLQNLLRLTRQQVKSKSPSIEKGQIGRVWRIWGCAMFFTGGGVLISYLLFPDASWSDYLWVGVAVGLSLGLLLGLVWHVLAKKHIEKYELKVYIIVILAGFFAAILGLFSWAYSLQ